MGWSASIARQPSITLRKATRFASPSTWGGDRVPDAGLRGQLNHAIRSRLREERKRPTRVRQIQLAPDIAGLAFGARAFHAVRDLGLDSLLPRLLDWDDPGDRVR